MSYLAPVPAEEAVMETREASPANFLVKIDSFSWLDKHGIDKLETRVFEAGDYKWKLVIYLNGHETLKKEEGYVFVYLTIADKSAFPFKLGRRARRFHALKQEWGFKKFISKKDLTDPSNGYIVDDKCVFGAEVIVNENKAVTECISLKSVEYKHEFKISNFSTCKEEWVSEGFTVGGHKWMIKVYLCPAVSSNGPNSKRVKPCFIIRLKDQSIDHQHHQMTTYGHWFSASESCGFGWPSFITLSCLNDPKKGFIVNDCCLIEIEIAAQAISS